MEGPFHLVSFLCSSGGVEYEGCKKKVSILNKGCRSLQKLNYRLKWLHVMDLAPGTDLRQLSCRAPSVKICSEACRRSVPSGQSDRGAGRYIKYESKTLTLLSSCETPKEIKILGRTILCSPHTFVVHGSALKDAGKRTCVFFVMSTTRSISLLCLYAKYGAKTQKRVTLTYSMKTGNCGKQLAWLWPHVTKSSYQHL